MQPLCRFNGVPQAMSTFCDQKAIKITECKKVPLKQKLKDNLRI